MIYSYLAGHTFTLGKFVRSVQSSSYIPGFNPQSSNGAWVAAINDDKQFLQVSFDSPKEIKKIKMAPIMLEKGKIAMVMRFKVLSKTPEEKTFMLYKFPDGNDVSYNQIFVNFMGTKIVYLLKK